MTLESPQFLSLAPVCLIDPNVALSACVTRGKQRGGGGGGGGEGEGKGGVGGEQGNRGREDE